MVCVSSLPGAKAIRRRPHLAGTSQYIINQGYNMFGSIRLFVYLSVCLSAFYSLTLNYQSTEFVCVSVISLRFVKGAFQTKSFCNFPPKCCYFLILHTPVVSLGPMNSPVQVEVPKWPGYFSQALIACYKP